MRSKLNTGGRKDLIKSRPVLKFFLRKLTQKKRLRSVKSETHQQLSCKASRESTTLTGSSFSNLRKGRRPMNQLKKLKGCKQKYDKYAYRFRRILNTKSIDPHPNLGFIVMWPLMMPDRPVWPSLPLRWKS